MDSNQKPNPSGKIVIAGGTGLIGLHTARLLLAEGCEVVLISRHKPKATGEWQHVQWDGRTVDDWAEHLDGAAAVVNLAGRTVDCIKTPDHCDQILRSRVEATQCYWQGIVHGPIAASRMGANVHRPRLRRSPRCRLQ